MASQLADVLTLPRLYAPSHSAANRALASLDQPKVAQRKLLVALAQGHLTRAVVRTVAVAA